MCFHPHLSFASEQESLNFIEPLKFLFATRPEASASPGRPRWASSPPGPRGWQRPHPCANAGQPGVPGGEGGEGEPGRALPCSDLLPTFRHEGRRAVLREGVWAGKGPGGATPSAGAPRAPPTLPPPQQGRRVLAVHLPSDGLQDCHLPGTGAARADRSLLARCRKAPDKDPQLSSLSDKAHSEATLFAEPQPPKNLLDSVSRSKSRELIVQSLLEP